MANHAEENLNRVVARVRAQCGSRVRPSQRTGSAIRWQRPSARVEFETDEEDLSLWCWVRTDRWSAGLTVHGDNHEDRARQYQRQLGGALDRVIRTRNLSASWLDGGRNSSFVVHVEQWIDSVHSDLPDDEIQAMADVICSLWGDLR